MPGATIFEATAGNTGVGLALIGSGRGYKTVLAVPEGFSQEKVTLMEALGAEVIRTSKDDGMQGAIDYVKERAAKHAEFFRRRTIREPGQSRLPLRDHSPRTLRAARRTD